jgi:hypothetical protein
VLGVARKHGRRQRRRVDATGLAMSREKSNYRKEKFMWDQIVVF